MRIEKPQSDNSYLTITPFNVLQRAAVESILRCETAAELTTTLSSFSSWVWDRGDLMCWTPVLNRLDQVLETYLEHSGLLLLPNNQTYQPADQHEQPPPTFHIDHSQLTVDLIVEVLRVTHLILESCAAKPMYNSLERVAILLDSMDSRIVGAAIPVMMLHAFSARKARKSVDVHPLLEIQARLAIFANSPAQAAASDAGTLPNVSPLTFYNDASWKPDNEASAHVQCSDSNSSYTEAISNATFMGLLGNSTSTSSVALERQRNVAFLAFMEEKHVSPKDWRALRQRCRVLLAAAEGLPARRRLVTMEVYALMALLTINPQNFQVHIAINTHLLMEAAFLLRCHRHLTYHTLVVVIDLWVAILHERIQHRAVASHLQLNAPHGLLADLLRHYLADVTLLPPESDLSVALPELLEKRVVDDRGVPVGRRETGTDVASRATDNVVLGEATLRLDRPPDTFSVECLQESPSSDCGYFTSAFEAYQRFCAATEAERGRLVQADRQVRKHADVVAAILDLLHEALQNPTAPCLAALTHPSLIAAVLSLFRNRDYRYLQTMVSSLRLMEVFYDHCPSNVKATLQELDAVGHTGARARYEVAKMRQLIAELKSSETLTDLSPWQPQSYFMAKPNGKEELSKVVKQLSRGRGVPSGWKGLLTEEPQSLQDIYFWQAMEEIANRRCLLVALVKEGPVFHYYLNGGSVDGAAGLADVFVRHFSLAYRRIIKDYELVGYPVLTAVIQSLNDMLTEEPGVQPVFISEGVMSELYACLGNPDVMASESCLNMIPGVLVTGMHHNSGAELIKRLDYKPLLDLIRIVQEPSLVYFDRVSGITSSIGQTVEDVVRNDAAVFPLVLKVIQKTFVDMLKESEKHPVWKAKRSSEVSAKVKRELFNFTACSLGDLEVPATPPHRYLSDLLSNVCRMIHAFAQPSSASIRYQLAGSCLRFVLLFYGVSRNPLRATPALPPLMFQVTASTHPATSLLRQMMTALVGSNNAQAPDEKYGSCFDLTVGRIFRTALEGSIDVLTVLNEAAHLVNSKQTRSFLGLSNLADETFAPDVTTPAIKDSLFTLRKRLVMALTSLGSSLHAVTTLNRDSNLLLNSRASWISTLLASLNCLLPVLGPVFAVLLKELYNFSPLLQSVECPNILGLRPSLHEHAAVRVNRLFVKANAHHPMLSSACFRLPGVDPFSAGINRIHLGSNCFLWSSLAEYAYSMGNATLEKGVMDDNALLNDSAPRMDDMGPPTEPENVLFPWESSTVLKELMRTVCQSIRSFLASSARVANAATTSGGARRLPTPADRLTTPQRTLAVNIASVGSILLKDFEPLCGPCEGSVSPLLLQRLEAAETAESRKALFMQLSVDCRRAAEALDILYRCHVDDKAQGSVLAVTLDASYKLGQFTQAVNAIQLSLNIQHALIVESERRDRCIDSPEVFLSKYLQQTDHKTSAEWRHLQSCLNRIVSVLDEGELEAATRVFEKCVQSSVSYCEKLTSWKRLFNSTSASFMQRTSRPANQSAVSVSLIPAHPNTSPETQQFASASPSDTSPDNIDSDTPAANGMMPGEAAENSSPESQGSGEDSQSQSGDTPALPATTEGPAAAPLATPVAQSRGDLLIAEFRDFCGAKLLDSIQLTVTPVVRDWWALLSCRLRQADHIPEPALWAARVFDRLFCQRSLTSLFRCIHHLLDSQTANRRAHAAGWRNAHNVTADATHAGDRLMASLGITRNPELRRVAGLSTWEDELVQALVEMGFPRAHAIESVHQTGATGPEDATDWALNHAAGAVEEEPEAVEAPASPVEVKVTRAEPTGTSVFARVMQDMCISDLCCDVSLVSLPDHLFRRLCLRSLPLCRVNLLRLPDYSLLLDLIEAWKSEARADELLDYDAEGHLYEPEPPIARAAQARECSRVCLAQRLQTEETWITPYVDGQTVRDEAQKIWTMLPQSIINALANLMSKSATIGDFALRTLALPLDCSDNETETAGGEPESMEDVPPPSFAPDSSDAAADGTAVERSTAQKAKRQELPNMRLMLELIFSELNQIRQVVEAVNTATNGQLTQAPCKGFYEKLYMRNKQRQVSNHPALHDRQLQSAQRRADLLSSELRSFGIPWSVIEASFYIHTAVDGLLTLFLQMLSNHHSNIVTLLSSGVLTENKFGGNWMLREMLSLMTTFIEGCRRRPQDDTLVTSTPKGALLLPLPLWAAIPDPHNPNAAPVVEENRAPLHTSNDQPKKPVPEGKYGTPGSTNPVPLAARPPSWFAATFLIFTKLLPNCDLSPAHSAQLETADAQALYLTEGEQKVLVTLALDTLALYPGPNNITAMAIAQLLSPLTLHHRNALAVLQYKPEKPLKTSWVGGGLGLLLRLPKTSQFQGALKAVAAICCNMLEDAGVLALLMRQHIRTLCETKGVRVTLGEVKTTNEAKEIKGTSDGRLDPSAAPVPAPTPNVPEATSEISAEDVATGEYNSYAMPLAELLRHSGHLARRHPAMFETLLSAMCALRTESLLPPVAEEEETPLKQERQDTPPEVDEKMGEETPPGQDEKMVAQEKTPVAAETSEAAGESKELVTETAVGDETVFVQLLSPAEMESNLNETPAGRRVKKLLASGGRPPVAAWALLSALVAHLQAFTQVSACSRQISRVAIQNAEYRHPGGLYTRVGGSAIPPISGKVEAHADSEPAEVEEFLARLTVDGKVEEGGDYVKPNVLYPFMFGPDSILYIVHVVVVAFPGLIPFLARLPPGSVVDAFCNSLAFEAESGDMQTPECQSPGRTLSADRSGGRGNAANTYSGEDVLMNISCAPPPWKQELVHPSNPQPIFKLLWKNLTKELLTVCQPAFSDSRPPHGKPECGLVNGRSVLHAARSLVLATQTTTSAPVCLTPEVGLLIRLVSLLSTIAVGNLDVRRRLFLETLTNLRALTVRKGVKQTYSQSPLAGSRTGSNQWCFETQRNEDKHIVGVFFFSNILLRLLHLPQPVIPKSALVGMAVPKNTRPIYTPVVFSASDLALLRHSCGRLLSRLDLQREDSGLVSHLLIRCLETLCRPNYLGVMPYNNLGIPAVADKAETIEAAKAAETVVPDASSSSGSGDEEDVSDLSEAMDEDLEFVTDNLGTHGWEVDDDDGWEDIDHITEEDEVVEGVPTLGEVDDSEDEEEGSSGDEMGHFNEECTHDDLLEPPALPHEADQEEQVPFQLPSGATAPGGNEAFASTSSHVIPPSGGDLGFDGMEIVDEEYDEDEEEVPRVRDEDDEDELDDDGTHHVHEEGGLDESVDLEDEDNQPHVHDEDEDQIDDDNEHPVTRAPVVVRPAVRGRRAFGTGRALGDSDEQGESEENASSLEDDEEDTLGRTSPFVVTHHSPIVQDEAQEVSPMNILRNAFAAGLPGEALLTNDVLQSLSASNVTADVGVARRNVLTAPTPADAGWAVVGDLQVPATNPMLSLWAPRPTSAGQNANRTTQPMGDAAQVSAARTPILLNEAAWNSMVDFPSNVHPLFGSVSTREEATEFLEFWNPWTLHSADQQTTSPWDRIQARHLLPVRSILQVTEGETPTPPSAFQAAVDHLNRSIWQSITRRARRGTMQNIRVEVERSLPPPPATTDAPAPDAPAPDAAPTAETAAEHSGFDRVVDSAAEEVNTAYEMTSAAEEAVHTAVQALDDAQVAGEGPTNPDALLRLTERARAAVETAREAARAAQAAARDAAATVIVARNTVSESLTPNRSEIGERAGLEEQPPAQSDMTETAAVEAPEASEAAATQEEERLSLLNAEEEAPQDIAASLQPPPSPNLSERMSAIRLVESTESADAARECGLAGFEALASGLGLTRRQLIDVLQIDPEFLLAVPSDMRQEAILSQLTFISCERVLELRNSNVAAWRESAAAEEPPAPSEEASVGESGDAAHPPLPTEQQVPRPFLLALPPTLQRMVRRTLSDAANTEEEELRGVDFDNATFLATLDPALRRDVLMTASQEFLATLPPNYFAEAQQLRRVRAPNIIGAPTLGRISNRHGAERPDRQGANMLRSAPRISGHNYLPRWLQGNGEDSRVPSAPSSARRRVADERAAHSQSFLSLIGQLFGNNGLRPGTDVGTFMLSTQQMGQHSTHRFTIGSLPAQTRSVNFGSRRSGDHPQESFAFLDISVAPGSPSALNQISAALASLTAGMRPQAESQGRPSTDSVAYAGPLGGHVLTHPAVVFAVPCNHIGFVNEAGEIQSLSDVTTPRANEVPVLIPMDQAVATLPEWKPGMKQAREPALACAAIADICRLFYLAKQINRRDLHKMLLNLVTSHPASRNLTMENFMLILWSAATDLHSERWPAESPEARALSYPPRFLYQNHCATASTLDFVTFAATSLTALPIVCYRVLEHLRSLFSVDSDVAAFFCKPFVHPAKFNPDAWLGDDTFLEENMTSPPLTKTSSESHPLRKTSSVPRRQAHEETALLLTETKRKKKKEWDAEEDASGRESKRARHHSGGLRGIGPNIESAARNMPSDPADIVYPINVLITLLSSSFYRSKVNHITHVFCAIEYLLLGKANSAVKPTEPPAPEPAPEPAAAAAVHTETTAKTAAATTEAPAPTKSVHDDIVAVVSPDAGRCLVELFCWGQEGKSLVESQRKSCNDENALWDALQGVNNLASQGQSNGHAAITGILHKLYHHPMHKKWIREQVHDEVKNLFRQVAHLLNMTSSSLSFSTDISFSTPADSPTQRKKFPETLKQLESRASSLAFTTDLVLAALPRVCLGIQDVLAKPIKEALLPLPDRLLEKKDQRSRMGDAPPPEPTQTEVTAEQMKDTTIKQVSDFVNRIVDETSLWKHLDRTLKDIALAHPHLAYVPNADERGDEQEAPAEAPPTRPGASPQNAPAMGGPVVSRRREVTTRRRRAPVRRGNPLPQDLQTAEMFGGACSLPVVLNRLVPLIEVFMFIQIITVSSELKLGYLLPSFFSSSPTNGTPSVPSKEKWKTESGKEIGYSQYRQAAIRSAHSEIKNLLADSEESILPISHEKFISFCEIHQKPLNGLMRQQPQLVMTSFSPAIHLAPMCVWFDNKRHYFRQKIKAIKEEGVHPQIRLTVRRNQLFTDSFHQLRTRSRADDLKGRLVVSFEDEEGVDAGGLTREWFSILAREMFNPDYALFRREGSKSEFNHPNPLSCVNPDHLHFFKFIGLVIGKALFDGHYLDCYFTRPFYKIMLGRKITPQDAESIDPEFYRNLQLILGHKLEDLGLDLNFTAERDEFGKTMVVELKNQGATIPVTDENKHEYVRLLCENKIMHGIEQQVAAFLEGFHDLIPEHLLSIFDDRELELLISGLPTIDLADLKRNTDYRNYTSEDPQIKWFWEILESFDQNQLATFLQFTTGTSRVPLGGFRYLMGMRGPQRFVIVKAFGEDRLPAAHTCFNQLDLPDYPAKDKMKTKLIQAITEGKEGFGFM